MRGTAYDTYTGSSWNTDWDEKKSGRYVYGDAANDAQKRLAFGLDLPLAETSLYSQVIRGMNVRVDLYQNSTNLYTVGRTASIQTEVGGTDLYFNRRGEVFAQTNMRAPISYTVGARVFGRSTETERSELAYIASRAARDADPQYESVAGQYTQLPSKLPERVRQAAADATLGIVEPYKMAEALETYLSSNFRYTLTPSNVPSGRDFVEYFLETGEGYCVYFASAMAVMARSLGIPSRMVCGYGVKPAGYHSWIATGTEAHAWVECYFKGARLDRIRSDGGIQFPQTGGRRRGFSRRGYHHANHHVFFPGWDHHGRAGGHDDGDGYHPAGGHHDGIGAGTTTAAGGPGSEESGMPMGLLGRIFGIAGGVLLLALAVVWRVLACAKRYRLDAVRQKRRRPGEQAEYYYADYLRQLHLLGYDPLANETMKQFAGRILTKPDGDAACAVPGTAQEVFRLMMDWRYGEQEPSPEEVERLSVLHEELEELVKKRVPAVVYLVRRVLMLGG